MPLGAADPACCPPQYEEDLVEDNLIVSPVGGVSIDPVPPKLDIGRAYSAKDAAAILGIAASVLNERVRQGRITPVFPTGDRSYSGYTLAKLLNWPLSDDPMDYRPGREPVEPVKVQRRRPVAVR